MKQPERFASRTSRKPSGRRKRGSWSRLLPWGVAIGLLVLVIMGFMPKPLTVEVAEVKYGPLTVSVFEEGKTRIRNRYIVTAPVPAFLERLELRAGDKVVKGETVLAVLRPEKVGLLDVRTRTQFEARLRGAQAAEELRKAELERVHAMLELAKKEYARIDTLYKNKSIPVQEWDNAASLVQVRLREVRAAEFALQVAGYEIEQARAALLQQEPDQPQYEPIRILSPVSGYILQVFEESARAVTPMTPILEVGDPNDLEAEIELLSMDAVMVKPGAKVSIERWGGELPLQGRVTVVEKGGYTKISALGVEEQRVKVRVDFTEPFPDEQYMGDRYRVEARIVTWHEEDVLQIPAGALFRRGTEWWVFVINLRGRAELRKVQVGRQNGLAAQILDGLTQGETVILHPSDSLAPGGRVVAQDLQ